jgi:hypothetical protein
MGSQKIAGGAVFLGKTAFGSISFPYRNSDFAVACITANTEITTW